MPATGGTVVALAAAATEAAERGAAAREVEATATAVQEEEVKEEHVAGQLAVPGEEGATAEERTVAVKVAST
eukprot:2460232-Prymnesium_polylepis.1